MSESTGDLSKKIISPTLAVILNFCMKCKNIVSKTERARVILAKFLTHSESAYCIHWKHPVDTLVTVRYAAVNRETFGVNTLRTKKLHQLGSPNLRDIFIGGVSFAGTENSLILKNKTRWPWRTFL